MSASSSADPRFSDRAEAETQPIGPIGIAEEHGAAVPASGRYVIVEQIGSGGMGRVYRAYDPKLQREVALKQLKRNRLSEDEANTLVAEARAMAQLSHPNVVAVYDVDDDGDALALIMEYVPGMTLSAWLRRTEPSWSQIVRRFVDAGRGIAAAHRAGVLHRDFKPANVLVSEDGGTKVTDFGLAKATPRPEEPVSTITSPERVGTGFVMGTPRYMAPEQHLDEALTTAVDQYGFCVALWEALCKEPPFAGPELGKKKIEGPPPWPATTVPAGVADAVTRGLAATPRERWPSMTALLDELDSQLRPRPRSWVAIAAAVGLVGVSAGAYWQWRSAKASLCTGAERELVGTWDAQQAEAVKSAMLGIGRDYAHQVWTRTQLALDQYATDWVQMHNATCRATTLEGTQSAAMLDLRMACLGRAKSQLGAAVEVLEDADAEVVQTAHTLTDALPPLSRCADTRALGQGVEPPLPADADAVEAARTNLDRARALDDAGRYGDAQAALERARTELDGVDYPPARTELTLLDGHLLSQRGKYEEARAALNDALTRAAESRQWMMMAEASIRLMYVVGELQQLPAEGLHHWPAAHGLSRGSKHLEARARNARARVLYAQGNYSEAEAEYRASIALRIEELGPDHPVIASARNNLASALWAQGKHALAETEHRAVLTLRVDNLGDQHPLVATSRNNLANVLFSRGAYAEAEAELRQAVRIRERALGAEHPSVAVARGNLASALCMLDRCDEGEKELRSSLEVARTALGEDHPRVAMIRGNLAAVLRNQNELEAAEVEYRAALASHERTLDADHPTLAQSRTTLALLLLERARYDEALSLAEAAWKRRQRDDTPPGQKGTTAFLLARALWNSSEHSDRERARRLARVAQEAHGQAGPSHEQSQHDVGEWLEAHPVQ